MTKNEICSFVSDNAEEFFKWYLNAAEHGNINAMDVVGDCYYYGEGVEKDKVKAFEWYMQAAEQGNRWSQNRVGNYYYGGEYVEKDFQEAVKWYKKAAEQGLVDAQAKLAYCYHYGKGVEKDADCKYIWYAKATSHEYLKEFVKNKISEELLEDIDMYCWDEDLERYTELAAQGNVDAQYLLGDYYYYLYEEDSVEPHFDTSLKWFKKAAEQGDVLAVYRIGISYEESWHLDDEVRDKMSFEWYLKAAEQGFELAQEKVGRAYRLGCGVEKNQENAVEWYGKAGMHNISAMYNILRDYFGVSRDNMENSGIAFEKLAGVAFSVLENMGASDVRERYGINDGKCHTFSELYEWNRRDVRNYDRENRKNKVSNGLNNVCKRETLDCYKDLLKDEWTFFEKTEKVQNAIQGDRELKELVKGLDERNRKELEKIKNERIKANEEEIQGLIKIAEETNDAQAQLNVANWYRSKEYDTEVLCDKKAECLKWLRKAAEQGNEKAKFYIRARYK